MTKLVFSLKADSKHKSTFENASIKKWLKELEKVKKSKRISEADLQLVNGAYEALLALSQFRTTTHKSRNKELIDEATEKALHALKGLKEYGAMLGTTAQHAYLDNVVKYFNNSIKDRLLNVYNEEKAKEILNKVPDEPVVVVDYKALGQVAEGQEVTASPYLLALQESQLLGRRVIGHGAFGECSIATLIAGVGMLRDRKLISAHNNKIVIKRVLNATAENKAAFRLEGIRGERLRAACERDNLLPPVNLTSLATLDGEEVILSRLAEKGTATEFIKSEIATDREYPHNQLIQMMCDIYNGMDFLHANGLLHLDIAVRNILVDANGQALLGDLGLAEEIDPNDPNSTTSLSSNIRPLRWASKEVMDCLHYPREAFVSRTSDLHSLKITMLEMLALGANLKPEEIFGTAPLLDFASETQRYGDDWRLGKIKAKLKEMLTACNHDNKDIMLDILDKFDLFFSAKVHGTPDFQMQEASRAFDDALDSLGFPLRAESIRAPEQVVELPNLVTQVGVNGDALPRSGYGEVNAQASSRHDPNEPLPTTSVNAEAQPTSVDYEHIPAAEGGVQVEQRPTNYGHIPAANDIQVQYGTRNNPSQGPASSAPIDEAIRHDRDNYRAFPYAQVKKRSPLHASSQQEKALTPTGNRSSTASMLPILNKAPKGKFKGGSPTPKRVTAKPLQETKAEKKEVEKPMVNYTPRSLKMG